MKKLSLLMCAIAVSALVFAVPTQRKPEKTTPVTNRTIHFAECADITPNPGILTQSVAEIESDTMFGHYMVSNVPSFQSGTPSTGIGYVNEAQIIVPYTNSVTFENVFGLKSSWWMNGQEVASDANSYTIKKTTFGTYGLPIMKTPKYEGDTFEVVFKDYQFGNLYNSYYVKYGFENYLNVAPDWASMTKCAMFTEDPGTSSYPSYGNDWTFVSAGNYGKYAYGTKLTNPWKKGEYFDTIMSLILCKEVLYCDHISVGVWTQGTSIMGENDSIKLSIYPISEEGKIDFTQDPLYTSYATINEYTDNKGVTPGTNWYGTLNFYFTQEDEWGGVEEIPAIMNGNFVVVFTDFNDGSENFGFIQDYYDPMTGYTYFLYDGKISSAWQSPSDLLINFYGVQPAVRSVPTKFSFTTLDAASLKLSLETNVWDDDWSWSELPEWLDIEITGEYDTIVDSRAEAGYYLEYKYKSTMKISMSQATEYRETNVDFNLLGKEFSIFFSQGEPPAGLNDVKFINDDKRYDVLGKEVNENYKGIVIINGKKQLQ